MFQDVIETLLEVVVFIRFIFVHFRQVRGLKLLQARRANLAPVGFKTL
jgi:hypothetical protein